MPPTLTELLATARQQITVAPDADPMERLFKEFEKTMLAQNEHFTSAFKDLEKRISDKMADEVVEGQQQLRNSAIRKGGWTSHDNAEVYERLIDPAGLTMEQKLTMPDRQLQKYLPKETYERVKAFQELNDDAMLLGWIMATRKTKSGTISAIDIESNLKGTRTWKSLQSVVKALVAVGAAGAGAEWMPTSFSSQLIDVITISLKVAAQFSRIDIPTNTFKIPIATTDDIAFLVPEASSDQLLDQANEYPKFTPGTGNITFNAKKLAAIVVFTEEAEEDSIIPLLPFIKLKIANAMANAQERATLDGDVTATHMDIDVTAATDCRKAWPGLRFKALVAAARTQDLSTFNLDTVRSLREIMTPAFAESGDDLFYTTSVRVMLKMLKFPEFLTLDKLGPQATIITGQVGKLDGSPVLTSKYSRDDVSATGLRAGSGNTTSLLYLQDRRGFWYGDRRAITIDSARMIMSGLGFMVISQRLDFRDIYPVSNGVNRHGALGINIQ